MRRQPPQQRFVRKQGPLRSATIHVENRFSSIVDLENEDKEEKEKEKEKETEEEEEKQVSTESSVRCSPLLPTPVPSVDSSELWQEFLRIALVNVVIHVISKSTMYLCLQRVPSADVQPRTPEQEQQFHTFTDKQLMYWWRSKATPLLQVCFAGRPGNEYEPDNCLFITKRVPSEKLLSHYVPFANRATVNSPTTLEDCITELNPLPSSWEWKQNGRLQGGGGGVGGHHKTVCLFMQEMCDRWTWRPTSLHRTNHVVVHKQISANAASDTHDWLITATADKEVPILQKQTNKDTDSFNETMGNTTTTSTQYILRLYETAQAAKREEHYFHALELFDKQELHLVWFPKAIEEYKANVYGVHMHALIFPYTPHQSSSLLHHLRTNGRWKPSDLSLWLLDRMLRTMNTVITPKEDEPLFDGSSSSSSIEEIQEKERAQSHRMLSNILWDGRSFLLRFLDLELIHLRSPPPLPPVSLLTNCKQLHSDNNSNTKTNKKVHELDQLWQNIQYHYRRASSIE